MGGGTGRLPGWGVFYSGFKNCLYGRRDGITGSVFFIPALKTVYMGGGTLFILGLHENVSTLDDFSRDNLQHNIVPAKRTQCLYVSPALAGTPLCRTGRKTSRQNYFHIDGMGQIRDIVYMHGARSLDVLLHLPHINSPYI